MDFSLLPRSLALISAPLVGMTMFIQIAWGVARMVVVLARLFLLPRFVAMAVLVQITGRVPRVFVMLAGCFLCHTCVLGGFWNRSPQ